MKAAVYTRYGPPEVLQVRDVPKPLPADDEVLVRVHVSAVNRTDTATISAIPFFARIVTGLLRPKRTIPGTEFAGVVEATGKNVTKLQVGDRVFGFNDLAAGAQAEYLLTTEDKALTIPAGKGFEDVMGIEGLHYALNSMNKMPLNSGSRVLVYGATGAIGSAAVQLLKHLGITVTAVCDTQGVALLQSLGADRVVDYTQQDFTQQNFTGDNERYDLVFDAVGKVSFFQCKRLIKPGGAYVSSDLGFMSQNIFLPMITPLIKPLIGKVKVLSPFPVNIPRSLALFREMIEQGHYRAIIDRRYTLDDIVEAYRYVKTGKKIGSVVVTVHEGAE